MENSAKVLQILREQEPATLTFRHLDFCSAGKLRAEVSEVETSPKDAENHSASLSKFLLLSERNEASSKLGQKFKGELTEPKPLLFAFCDTSYHLEKPLLF